MPVALGNTAVSGGGKDDRVGTSVDSHLSPSFPIPFCALRSHFLLILHKDPFNGMYRQCVTVALSSTHHSVLPAFLQS